MFSFFQQLNQKYRITQDLEIIYRCAPQFYKLYQNSKKNQHPLFYSFEEVCKNPKYKDKEAIIYLRPVPENSVSKNSDDAFKVEKIKYAELYGLVLKMSWYLANELGVKKGDVVALFIPNKPIFIIFWLALWNIGASPCFLNYNLSHSPLIHSVKVVQPTLVLVDKTDPAYKNFSDSEAGIKEVTPNADFLKFDEFELLCLIKEKPEFRQLDSIRDEGLESCDVGDLVYTSGTTGLPKSAITSWRRVFMAAKIFPCLIHMSDETVLYTAMPMYHGTASNLGCLPMLCNGGTVCIGYKFSVSTFWTQVKLSGANTIQYVGETCRHLLNSSVTEDELKVKGQVKLAQGNGLRPDIWQKFKDRFGIQAIGEFYAASESPFVTSCYETDGFGVGCVNNYGWIMSKLTKIQYTLVGTEEEDDATIFRNKDGFCEEAELGQKGELIMKILNPKRINDSFNGYYKNEEASYSKLITDVFKKGDVWVRSDDLMRWGTNDGCLRFIDRLGDTYRWKSENVSTTEVENELLKGVELKHCIVTGVRVPEHEGRCGYAILQTKNENQESPEERQAILQRIAEVSYSNLPHYARPVFVRFDIAQLTSNHKISKKAFRDPILPAGKSGKQEVFYLNAGSKSYEPLDQAIYNSIVKGNIRI